MKELSIGPSAILAAIAVIVSVLTFWNVYGSPASVQAYIPQTYLLPRGALAILVDTYLHNKGARAGVVTGLAIELKRPDGGIHLLVPTLVMDEKAVLERQTDLEAIDQSWAPVVLPGRGVVRQHILLTYKAQNFPQTENPLLGEYKLRLFIQVNGKWKKRAKATAGFYLNETNMAQLQAGSSNIFVNDSFYNYGELKWAKEIMK